MKKIYLLYFGILLFIFQSCMKEPDIHPNTYEGNFKALWHIIDTRYCYLDYKKINWDSVYTVYLPKVKLVKNNYEFFDVMANMLAVLKDGHVNLYSSFDRSRYWKWYTDYPANFSSSVLFGSKYLGSNYRIAGALRYNQIANGQVGYIYYGSFSDDFSNANMQSVFDVFSNCKGIIIDVRNNGGGSLSYAELLASYFFEEKTLTGYLQHKTGDGHSDFSEPIPVYTDKNKYLSWQRPVVVLTNRMSYSATNDFVSKMTYAPKAIIVGDQTGGGGGMPFSSELPNGWMIRFSASPMFNAQKENIEWGIYPDIRVNMNPIDMNNGFDTIIETAVQEILKQ